VYPAIVALVGAGLVPWRLFAATRLLGGSALAALLAGILALAPDETYFWWFMVHGTLPAAISAALATLTVALAWRVFVRHDPRRWLTLALVASLTIGLFWALFALMDVMMTARTFAARARGGADHPWAARCPAVVRSQMLARHLSPTRTVQTRPLAAATVIVAG
jgi:hypothetical protein